MMGKVAGFISTVAAVPIVGQIPAESVVGKLAVGSAQFVLSVVVVIEALAIFKMFKIWRADIAQERLDRQNDRDKFEEIIRENAKASTQLATSNEALKESVYHFAKVVEGCDKKQ